MALCPFAVQRPVSAHGGAIGPPLGCVIHVTAGQGDPCREVHTENRDVARLDIHAVFGRSEGEINDFLPDEGRKKEPRDPVVVEQVFERPVVNRIGDACEFRGHAALSSPRDSKASSEMWAERGGQANFREDFVFTAGTTFAMNEA